MEKSLSRYKKRETKYTYDRFLVSGLENNAAVKLSEPVI